MRRTFLLAHIPPFAVCPECGFQVEVYEDRPNLLIHLDHLQPPAKMSDHGWTVYGSGHRHWPVSGDVVIPAGPPAVHSLQGWLEATPWAGKPLPHVPPTPFLATDLSPEAEPA